MGNVIEHEYLGSEKIIKDLQKVEGYDFGKINLRRDAWRRNPQTKRINGIKI